MEWCKFYANVAHQPEVQAAEDEVEGALSLLFVAFGYVTEAETGGFIPDSQVRRFGLANTEAKVKALAAEEIWLREDRGWRLNPDLWSEERNLSDAIEQRRERDRERQRRHRAKTRPASDPASRDGHVTGHVTSQRDNPPVEERRGEKNKPPPPPPRRRRSDKTGKNLLNLAVSPGGGDEPNGQDNQNDMHRLVAEVHADHRPDWSPEKISRALAAVRDRPWPLVRAAMLAVAADQDSDKPWRVTQDGPWWQPPPSGRGESSPAPRPDHCGQCDPLTRLTLGDQPRRCPACHPLRDEAQAAS
jgi:hypothetical protein